MISKLEAFLSFLEFAWKAVTIGGTAFIVAAVISSIIKDIHEHHLDTKLEKKKEENGN